MDFTLAPTPRRDKRKAAAPGGIAMLANRPTDGSRCGAQPPHPTLPAGNFRQHDPKTQVSGSLHRQGRAAANPLLYRYGVTTDPVYGNYCAYTLTVKLTASGGTNEWEQSFVDVAGNQFATYYSDNSLSGGFVNPLGQMTNRIDADGLNTLYAYNPKGELMLTAVDMDQSWTLDYATDRLTYTTNDVVYDNGAIVNRTCVFDWPVAGSATVSNLVSVSESSVDGLQSWRVLFNGGVGITNHSQTAYGTNGYRTVTSIAPDGIQSIATYQYGQLLSTVTTNATLGQLSGTSYAYDAQGRLSTTTDARNGTSTNY